MENNSEVPKTVLQPQAAPPMVAPSLPEAGQMLKNAFNFCRQHIANLAFFGLVPAAFSLPLMFGEKIGIAGVVIFSIASGVAALVAQNALVLAVAENGAPPDGVGGAYKRGLSFFFPILWASIIGGLATIGGVFLLIVPGIYVAMYVLFARYTVVLEGKRGLDALSASWHYAKGYAGAIFWRALVFGFVSWLFMLVTSFIGVIIFPVAPKVIDMSTTAGQYRQAIYGTPSQLFTNVLMYIFILPFGISYTYILYRALVQIKGAPAPESGESKRVRSKLIGLSIFAVVVIAALIVLAGTLLIQYWPQVSSYLRLVRN
jgi:hypothetical protein